MAIKNFTEKLSMFCKAGSTPGLSGLSADFHDAGHALSNMDAGADSVITRSVYTTRKSEGPVF